MRLRLLSRSSAATPAPAGLSLEGPRAASGVEAAEGGSSPHEQVAEGAASAGLCDKDGLAEASPGQEQTRPRQVQALPRLHPGVHATQSLRCCSSRLSSTPGPHVSPLPADVALPTRADGVVHALLLCKRASAHRYSVLLASSSVHLPMAPRLQVCTWVTMPAQHRACQLQPRCKQRWPARERAAGCTSRAWHAGLCPL